MRVGTPLSPTATRVMLPGAGEFGGETVISWRRPGTEVIAVDRYANASGHRARAILGLPADPRLAHPAASAITYSGTDAECMMFAGFE